MRSLPFILLVIGLAWPSLAPGEVFQVDASLDTGFLDQQPDNNMGANTHVPVGQSNSLAVRRSLFFMDISAAIPAGSTINSVDFEFDVTNQGGPQGHSGALLELHRATSFWTEGTGVGSNGTQTDDGATWNNRTSTDLWTTPGGDYDGTSLGSVFVDHTADGGGTITYSLGNAQLIAEVQDMLDNPADNFGFELKADDENLPGSAIRLTSRENMIGSLGSEARLIIDFTPPNTVVIPDSVMATRGLYISGDAASLAESDNVDFAMQRLVTDTQSRTEFEVLGTSPTASPASLEVTLEGAVFARSTVVQSIELWDYTLGDWELVDSRNATNMVDSTATVAATGDLNRFVDQATLSVQARIHFQSLNARQRFASNTDQFIWTIGQ